MTLQPQHIHLSPVQLRAFTQKPLSSERNYMYSIIPDIHADLNRLKCSLTALGDEAPFAFLGDFIDAGEKVQAPDDRAVLRLVKQMVDQGEAISVMGNHELNAILFHRSDAKGQPLRAHTKKNIDQHQSFVAQFGTGTTEALEWTEWFLHALPLWLDLGQLRLAHACWSDSAMAIVRARRPDGFLHIDDLEEIAEESTAFGQAVKAIVSGPEVRLPDPYSFKDFDQHVRHEVRIAWWRNDADTWRNAALSVPNTDELPDASLPPDVQSEVYLSDQPPVFVGHYKMKGIPTLEAGNAMCLDYPEMPCGYRWRGEKELNSENLIAVRHRAKV